MKTNQRVLILVGFLWLSGCGKTASNAPTSQTDIFHPNFSTEVGAGGSGVLCDGGPKGTYFEVMDVYEARKRNMDPQLGAPTLPVKEKLEIALKRLEVFSPVRANQYRTRAAEIMTSARYFTRGSMPHIGDDDPSDLESGCKILQIATRKKPIFPGDPEFLIDQRLYDRLDRDNQAVLFLHEVAYEEAAKSYGQLTSRPSRGFTSLFFSNRIESMDFASFLEFLGKVDFKTTDYAGLKVPTKIALPSDNRRAARLHLENGRVVSATWEVTQQQGDFYIVEQDFPYLNQRLSIGGGMEQEAFFSEPHKLRALYGNLEVVGSQTNKDGVPSAVIEDRGNRIRLRYLRDPSVATFDDVGRFQMLSVAKGSELRLKDEPKAQLISETTCVAFAADGVAEMAHAGACRASDSKLSLPKHWTR